MKQVVATSKGVKVIDVPSPMLQPGHVLVEVEYSFVSSGTEMASVGYMESMGSGVGSDVARNPDLLKKLANHLRHKGVRKTLSSVTGYLETRKGSSGRLATIGYSCAGRVVAVGENVTTLEPGYMVACAGADKATHSELVVVPETLTVKIPERCDVKSASSIAVGAIAMQGVRRANTQLGEAVAVIGLGLVGLITIQLLKAAGNRVIGLDPDSNRRDLAIKLGIDEATSDSNMFQKTVARFTEHRGVDVCLITAASQGNEIIQQAMEITRRKGKVVVVGIVGMDLRRNPFYEKEIDLLISTSYGPGRYDDQYENKGLDYPYAYVRWTEKRNMEEYLRLIAEGEVDVKTISEEYQLEDTPDAFDRLKSPGNKPAAVFISYSSGRTITDKKVTRVNAYPMTNPGNRLRLGVIGAGRFIKRVHLPFLREMASKVELTAIATRSGAGALETGRQFGAKFATTSYNEILTSKEIDSVLIGTRHNLHASITLQALMAGKNVFVEKPLTLTEKDLTEIESFYEDGIDHLPLLLTGFNRRFSPLASKLKKAIMTIGKPIVIDYQMNAEYLPENHWTNTDEGGGRNLGEACHIYDLFTYLTESNVSKTTSVNTITNRSHPQNANFAASFSFNDGSIATLTYTTRGSTNYPKELMHVYAGESVFVLNDFISLKSFGPAEILVDNNVANKGHTEIIKSFVAAVKDNNDWPIPLWQQVQATRMALKVESQINSEA